MLVVVKYDTMERFPQWFNAHKVITFVLNLINYSVLYISMLVIEKYDLVEVWNVFQIELMPIHKTIRASN